MPKLAQKFLVIERPLADHQSLSPRADGVYNSDPLEYKPAQKLIGSKCPNLKSADINISLNAPQNLVVKPTYNLYFNNSTTINCPLSTVADNLIID